MDETTIVAIRFDGKFEMDGEGNWGYVNGRTKARLIHTNCTYNELLEIAYEATNINPDHFQIKMKFIIRSCYKLDPIVIENDGDVKCFFKEYFRVDPMHTSPLFIEVQALQDTVEVGQGGKNCATAFDSRSGSNKFSLPRPAVHVNRSGIRDHEESIPKNQMVENTTLGWSSVNVHDEVNITQAECTLPEIDEYERLYNLHDYDVDYDDDTIERLHDDDNTIDDEIELVNERREGDGDEEFNDALEVLVVENFDVPFTSTGLRMDSVPIPPIAPNANESHRHHSHANERDS